MYPPRFRRGGGNRSTPPPFQSPPPHFNPNFLQNPNFYPPNTNIPIQSSNVTHQPRFQIPPPNYPPHNPSFPVRNPSFRPSPPVPSEGLEKVDRAVAKARLDLLAAGECGSAWKVSQAALLILQSDSWESVGFQMQQIPSLHRLLVTERQINAFIHCFVGVRTISSLYDLEVGICENEGVDRFEDLEMGPLVKYPLVVHYFSVSSDVKQVFKITTEQILNYLSEFMNTKNKISADELLDFIAKKCKVDGRDKLSVRIKKLRMYLSMIRNALESQTKAEDKCLEKIRRRSSNVKEKFDAIPNRFGSSGFSLPDESIRMFLTTWKDASTENTVGEVLDRMLNLYEVKKSEKIKQIFMLYPFIGLPNVAIKSMKSGMSDSIYDTFQNYGKNEVSNTTSEKHTDCTSIDVEPSEKMNLISTRNVVTVEEILKKVYTYFEQDHDIIGNSNLPLERNFNFLRKLCKLEHWLSEQFSVRDFSSLGYGDFFTFLEKQVSHLGQALQDCIMTGDTSEKCFLEASLHQDQLSVLLSQANLEWENDVLINEKIYQLLMWQFPSVCFKLKENGSIEDIREIVTKNKNNNLSKCILFSAPFFNKNGQKEGKFGSVTKKDAIELLLRAPLLIDLESWSHWDLIYSPSLGPLIWWLLNEVNNKELLCFFTRSGKILRIDHTATVDSFLEAFLQDSFFQVALQLASLFSLYGGEQNVPITFRIPCSKGF